MKRKIPSLVQRRCKNEYLGGKTGRKKKNEEEKKCPPSTKSRKKKKNFADHPKKKATKNPWPERGQTKQDGKTQRGQTGEWPEGRNVEGNKKKKIGAKPLIGQKTSSPDKGDRHSFKSRKKGGELGETGGEKRKNWCTVSNGKRKGASKKPMKPGRAKKNHSPNEKGGGNQTKKKKPQEAKAWVVEN